MPPESSNDMKSTAKLIAMFIRYGIEGFHREHLTDEQMRILNPLIRNAIYTALYAIEHAEEEWHCDQQLERMRIAIPSYWEPPVVWNSLINPEYDEEATRHFKRLHAEKHGLPAEEE